MKTIGRRITISGILLLVAGIAFIVPLQVTHAKDTDIYNVATKQNAYVLLDNSGSMGYGVYESNIDYGAMYDYLITLNNPTVANNKYIFDTVNGWAAYYKNHTPMTKIYLWLGQIGVTMATVNSKSIAFTGDAADPDYLWYSGNLVDTHTLIDASGNLSDDGTGQQRIKTDGSGYITFDGNRLPGSQDIKLTDKKVLYDGTVVNSGFGGMINAPGYYFSGYKTVTSTLNSAVAANSGDSNINFFVTGNWANMQAMYNLHYVTSAYPYPSGAAINDPAWKFDKFPLAQSDWSQVEYQLIYPNPVASPPNSADPYDTVSSINYYKANVIEANSVKKITPAGAVQIQVHFKSFDVNYTSSSDYDTLKIYDNNNVLKATYNNNNKPPGGWSAPVSSSAVYLKLSSNSSHQGKGYEVDGLRVTYYTDAYLMQDRMAVAKDAVTYSIDALKKSMNWGLATFSYSTSNGKPIGAGANISTLINPATDSDTQQGLITTAMSTIKPNVFTTQPAGFKANNFTGTYDITPLGEALQDVLQKGYVNNVSNLGSTSCAKNYVIVVTDGFPAGDTDWSRIKINGNTIAIGDTDNDHWTENPYQFTTPPPSYYDDVANYIYTHSWLDNSMVPDPTNSTVNVTTQQISFGAVQPLLINAATEGGGQYITAYNKTQLSAALYSMALQMANTVSFTAPIASVDAANKIQNGNDLYFSFFLPQGGSSSFVTNSWAGNLKKFEMGDGSAQRPNAMMIYDGANNQAINSNGEFIDPITDIWTNKAGNIDVKSNGAGAILLKNLQNDYTAANYWNRKIYTSIGGVLTKLSRDNISPAQLGVTDTDTRDKIINFVYGYSYNNNFDGSPASPPRDWILGSIIHSRPLVVDYYDPLDISKLSNRYIVVGANDGMLHVFDDTPGSGKQGSEVFAFIPEDLLLKLQNLPLNNLIEMVDGGSALYRQNNNPKYLIFGERRGGNSYWCLDISTSASDPSKWKVKWQYNNAEIQQTWSDIQIASMPVKVDSLTGAHTFQDVIIFSGGYDAVTEDKFPEPFKDYNNTGTPYGSDGITIDTAKWNVNDPTQNLVSGASNYYNFNPGMDVSGRGIFIVDIDDPTVAVPDGNGNQILPFKVTYGGTDTTTGNSQTRADMKYCFPASPSVVLGTYSYYYKDINNKVQLGIQPNTLKVVYGVDIYANMFKINYDFNEQIVKDLVNPSDKTLWKWTATNAWSVTKVFAGNPGSSRTSGSISSGSDSTDQGRKAFYPPAVSWGGSCSFFDKHNYSYPNVVFSGTDEIASLLFGTGDREHPNYKLTRNRMYSVYDDSSVSAVQNDSNGNFLKNIKVSTASYKENDLLNLTCDELGVNSTKTPAQKNVLRSYLTDDATSTDISGNLQLENGTENDAKGWYIVLEDQKNCSVTSGTLNTTGLNSTDNHDGEEILSAPILYAGIVYFTSYQPTQNDPCHPQGNGFAYSLDYCTGSAAYNLSTLNGDKLELTDRYMKYTDIYGIPSGFAVLVRGGQAGAMAMMGSKIVGPQGPGNFPIKGPGLGLELYYWREGNSQK